MKTHLLSLSLEELTTALTPLAMPKFRAKQIMEWVYHKRAVSFDDMTNISLPDRKTLADHFAILTSSLQRDLTAPDATHKLLLQWPPEPTAPDAAPAPPALTECVMIPSDEDPADPASTTTRRTACLSTQVGCPVRCAFCASGLEGLQQNLTVGQVIEQALRLTHSLPREGPGRRLTNIVFMGMGEPLANFNTTIAAVKTLMADWAFHISGRKITVSTVGLPPQMKRFADLELPVTLAISLHAPNDALRKQIIPWAEKISIAQIVNAGKYYFDKTGREVTLEYIMLDGERGGLNTLPEHARELAAIARPLRANVNLIYYNEVPELPFKRPSGQTMFAFQTLLRAANVNTHIRKSRGREIAAACGQLARQEKNLTRLTLRGE